jgi:hypothetical protein
MFHISKDTHTIIDVAQVDEIEPAVRTAHPARDHVDDISAEPSPSGHTLTRWGWDPGRPMDQS